jgi:uncharacterized protein
VKTVFADTSALVRAYLADEPDHTEMRSLLFDEERPVLASELARVEFARAVSAAGRAGRVNEWAILLDQFDLDCQPGGPIRLVELRPGTVLPTAHRLVLEHQLGTLDAIHLAVALEERKALAELGGLALVTRDDDQAAAARAEEFALL